MADANPVLVHEEKTYQAEQTRLTQLLDDLQAQHNKDTAEHLRVFDMCQTTLNAKECTKQLLESNSRLLCNSKQRASIRDEQKNIGTCHSMFQDLYTRFERTVKNRVSIEGALFSRPDMVDVEDYNRCLNYLNAQAPAILAFEEVPGGPGLRIAPTLFTPSEKTPYFRIGV